LVTAGSAVKLERCRQLGAIAGWNYNEGSFVDWVKVQTEGRGVNMILDFIGAPYFNQNLHALAVDGRLIIIGTLGGSKVPEVDLGRLLFRRLQVIGTALRSRSVETKLDLVRKFSAFALPRFSDGRLQAVVDRVFDWRDVAEAHRYMEQNQNVGKIVLQISR
jgi:NADPH:quinone reductase-like Zn-dependent oxidoreductase